VEESNSLVRAVKAELDGLNEQLRWNSPGVSGFSLAVIGVGLVAVSAAFSRDPAPWVFAGFAWMLYCFLLHALYVFLLRIYRRSVAEQLRGSALIERMALGWESLPDIHRWTVYPWRLTLGPRPATLKGMVRLVARNLDWYLREPRSLFRWHWLYGPACVAVLFAAIIMEESGLLAAAMAGFGILQPSNTWTAMLLGYTGAIVVVSIGQYGLMRQTVRVQVMRDYLAELFA